MTEVEFRTKPFTFDGSRLNINFSTSAAGGIQFEIQDADGQPIPGYALADSVEQIGNEIERTVTWKSGSDISTLSGKTVRLLCRLKDADLYSLQFGSVADLSLVKRISACQTNEPSSGDPVASGN